MFENGDISYNPAKALEKSCYKELEACHMFVLVIGGKYGSASSDQDLSPTEKKSKKGEEKTPQAPSITSKEYDAAVDLDIPIYVFIEKEVHAEYQTYKKNKNIKGVTYAHVDNKNIYQLIDSIYEKQRNNLVKGFENAKDITDWLRDQWAGRFYDFLEQASSNKPIESMEKQLANLNSVTESLKEYSEKIIEAVLKDEAKSKEIIKKISEDEKSRADYQLFLDTSIIEYFLKYFTMAGKDTYSSFIASKNYESFVNCLIEFDSTVENIFDSVEEFYDNVKESLIDLRKKLKLPPWEEEATKKPKKG